MNERVEMKRKTKSWPWFLGISLIVGVAACKHEPIVEPVEPVVIDDGGGTPTEPEEVTCDPDTVYFVQDILPLLVSSCANPECHDAINPEEGIRLYDYNHIIQH